MKSKLSTEYSKFKYSDLVPEDIEKAFPPSEYKMFIALSYSNMNRIREEKYFEAKAKGYTGEQCSTCSSMRVKRNGSCTVCEDCGTTSGCS